MASSLVDTFRLSRDPSEKDVARLVLLGIPAKNALNRLLESEETGMKSLVTYVASESGLSARDAGRRAERLSVTFERWARLKERRRLEQRVLELRGHMVSAILGPVMAFLSSLAPFVMSFQFLSAAPAPSGGFVVYAAFAMTIASSAFLGSFFSTRRRYIDPVVAGITFAVALQMTAPIANVPPPSLWAIK
ncbi:MAG: hypothetical protein E6K96_06105 [Thaumarchaeota archaeon]|nr:MAG: hypothetical protein E6K96_06105 [Nitrososphaerota archaeon]